MGNDWGNDRIFAGPGSALSENGGASGFMDVNPMPGSLRNISQLTDSTLAVILAGGRGSALGELTNWRAKAALPFGGKFRLIDFTLSNCFNSGIRHAIILTQYKSHSLIKHVRQGWLRKRLPRKGGICIVPAQQWIDEQTWYRGSADAIYQALDIIHTHRPENVLILNGEHVYSLDYGTMLAHHAASGADLTIACDLRPRQRASSYGVIRAEKGKAGGRIEDFEEMPPDPAGLPDDPDHSLVSMGIYIFRLKLLDEILAEDAANSCSQHNLGRNIIPGVLAKGYRLQAFPLRNPVPSQAPYWREIADIDDYYEANMDLLDCDAKKHLDLYHPQWQFRTWQEQLPPARFSSQSGPCRTINSIVSGGCVVESSRLEKSILFSNVKIFENCVLNGVLALPGSRIGAGSRLSNVILDNRSFIAPGTIIGDEKESNNRICSTTPKGRFLVTSSSIPI